MTASAQAEGVRVDGAAVAHAGTRVRPVLVSATDYMGGASRSAYRLHEGLRRVGCESRMFVGAKLRSDADVTKYEPSVAMPERLARMMRHLWQERALKKYAASAPTERTLFADDRTRWGADVVKQIPDADVIHLHWVGGFLDYGAFFGWLPAGKPLVMTLHDMADFTGGCCFDLGCGKFVNECGACPQLGSRDEGDLTRQIWLRKSAEYARLNTAKVRVVAPCEWMAREARRSPLLGRFETAVIPYGLDLEVFQPRERRVARDVLGIPMDAAVILFLADNVNMYRKGFHLLSRALEEVEKTREVFLLSLGKDATPELARFRHAHFDDITNDRTLSFVYSAADVFVLPSLGDNLPNTGLESIACGTPVAAFETGGIPEMVRPGVTGFLAPAGDALQLKGAILKILNDAAIRAQMSANCRRIALAEYDLAIQANRHIELYEQVCA